MNSTVKTSELAHIADALERIAQSLQVLKQLTGVQPPANSEADTTLTPTEKREEAPTPADQSTTYAREGTAAHELAAYCLLTSFNADAFLGTSRLVEGEMFCVDTNMAGLLTVS